MPKKLLELTEKIAENTHDVWAVGRLKEGWSCGEARTLVLVGTSLDNIYLPQVKYERQNFFLEEMLNEGRKPDGRLMGLA